MAKNQRDTLRFYRHVSRSSAGMGVRPASSPSNISNLPTDAVAPAAATTTPDNLVEGVVISSVDTKEMVRTQQALQRSSELLERTEALAKIGGWEVDLPTMKLTWTSETFKIAEIDPPVEPPLEEGINLFAPEARPTIAAAVQAAIDTGAPYDLELPIIGAKGSAGWVRTQGFAEMRDGKAVRLFGTFQDITERKRTHEALQRGRAMLERTEKLAGIGSFEWEIATNITTWSPEMFHIYGRDPALGAPNLQEQAELYTPQTVQLLYAAVEKLLSDGTPYELELMPVLPAGVQRTCLVKGYPERDGSGRIVRLAGLVQDITTRKLAEHYERFRSKTLELLAANKPLATLLEAIVLGVEQLQPAMLCSILLLDADGLHLGKGVAPSLPDFYNAALDGIAIGVGVGSCGTAAFTGERVIVDDIATHPYWALFKDLAASAGLGACWSQPIHDSVGKVLGTFAIYHRGPHTPVQADINLIEQVANLTSIAIERKQQQNQLEHIAHFDALTNLPNRSLLADRLQQSMLQESRRGQQLAVVYLDLDGFKAVNDLYGHSVGDRLLVVLATRMKDALREGDTLARIGGDEFVAVLVDLTAPEVGENLLNRLLTAAALPVQIGDLVLQVSASLGVTFYPQTQDVDADQLLRQADQAMYLAKVAGKNRYHFFDAAKDSNLRGHHESLERIRLALAQGEFVLHYQPKVNMRNGQVVGAEALIRWQHPEKGLLAPATFLPTIEDHPLAVTVGEWVIDTALHQMDVWHASGLHLPVSVNIGARQLQQPNFVERLKAILSKHPQVHPTDLQLEVLETSALEDIALVSKVIEDCTMIGVKFALDDFGTGYSSLTYLKRLRVAMLKIDQSFVRDMLDDPDDLAILEGIIGLAVAFRREVIAEGVETVAHGAALLQLGCGLAQGYGIARPMPAQQMPAWAATWRPDAAWCELPNSPEA